MQMIACPWCGPRGEVEFVYGGEAGIVRPVPAASVDDATWAQYLYGRHNEKGPHRELWCHNGGFGQWFTMVRDTATHVVVTAEKIGAR